MITASNHASQPIRTETSNELLTNDGKQYKKLNEMLDIKLNGVTYHIYSRFSDGHTLPELLDLVTLEKIERTVADTCFKV